MLTRQHLDAMYSIPLDVFMSDFIYNKWYAYLTQTTTNKILHTLQSLIRTQAATDLYIASKASRNVPDNPFWMIFSNADI